MKNKTFDQNRLILIVFTVISLFLIGFLIAAASGIDRTGDGVLTNFDSGWSDSEGNVYDIADVRANDDGFAPVVSKKLPSDVSDSDCLCFESYNVNIQVYVDGQSVYSFESKENPTGIGYGTGYHEVGLSSDMAGKTVTVCIERSNKDIKSKRGQIVNIYVGAAVDYVHKVMVSNILTVMASVFILFFGIVFLLISFVISDNERLPFDVASLGIASIIIGSWLLVLSNVFQLVSADIYTVRVLDRFLILVAGVPLICFFNSLTYTKSRIYPIIEFWLNVLSVALLLVLRYVAGIDMMTTFQRLLIVYFGQIIVLTIIMFVRHERYCRANGITSGLRFYYIGIAAFIVCALTDYGLFYFKKLVGNSYGAVTSIGTLVLVPIVLVQFIKWWTKDRRIVERERFTNRALQYALSSDSPDESIQLMLKFMGEELKCGRVVVFEDMHNGRFYGRYAWSDSRLGNRSTDLLYIPYKGIVEELIHSYRDNGNRFVIGDAEEYRDQKQSVYNLLVSHGVKNLVANPLEVDGDVTGLLLLLDMPADATDEASSVANLTSYFLSQLILRRDDQKRMRTYTYNDSMSGAQNRRAYDEFVSTRFDPASSFGYMVCAVDSLEEISDNEGFEAGDSIIADTVTIMGDVFGSENVYRMAGSRFAAFGFETDETYFRDDVERFIANAKDKGISVSTGAIYCINGTRDLRTVVKSANEKLKKSKTDKTLKQGPQYE